MHWTYQTCDADSDLQQGDILAPTDALGAVLREVHPHFCNAKYLAFTVSTQTCDLVRHKGEAKAKYISIAVVRALQDVLIRQLECVIDPVAPGIFRKSSRQDAKKFLARVFNQNEQALGLFYLHADAELGLGENCVAMLRINVSLRGSHYDTLVKARRGRLAAPFQGKYGWLLGNLYSRAASPDWQDQPGGKAQMDGLIASALDPGESHKQALWFDDEVITEGLKASVNFHEKDHGQLCETLESLRPAPPLERLANEVVSIATKVFGASPQMDTLKNRLLNNGKLNALVVKK